MPETPKDQQMFLARMRDIVFLATGVALVVISPWIKDQGWPKLGPILESASLNLGLVCIAVVVVGRMWRLCGGDPLLQEIAGLTHQVDRLSRSASAIENHESIGLRSAYLSLSNYGVQSDWDSLLEEAEERVDLMGRTLYGWADSPRFKRIVVNKIKNRKIIFRWLIMSRNNVYRPLIEKADPSSLLSHKIDRMEQIFREIRDRLPEDLKGNLQVREFLDNPLYCSTLRIDDRIFVVQYLSSFPSANSPFYCLRGQKATWPKTFRSEFEEVWESAEDLFAGEGRGGKDNAA